ncbi:MAG: hypothetical protein RL693_2472 [Verrucomicrobiota bacterium]|jgi:putative hydrolase of the HAD superfamily
MSSRAFLFDIGNVLVHFDFTPAIQRFARLSTAGETKIKKLISPFKDDLESGNISDEDFIAQSIERIGFRGTPEEFIAIWGDIFTENEPMIALVKKLAGNHPLYLLSNTSGLHKAWLFEHFDIFRLFEGGIYSHEARCMKPHEPIYRLALEQYQLDPAATFYIDDLSDNIITGQRLGFVCHHYSPEAHGALEEAVDAWLK